MYGAGAQPLKDVVTNFELLAGSHKALLGSFELIVFRHVLSSVHTMVSYTASTRASVMRLFDNVYGVCDGYVCKPPET